MKRALLLVLPASLCFAACDPAEPDDDLEAAAVADDAAEPDPGSVAAPEADGRRHRFKEKLARAMTELDTDKDGALSKEEAADHFIAHKFDKIDADADGKITTDELAAMKARHRGRHGGPGGHGGKMKSPEERAQRKLARFDTDGDGAITAAELGDHRMADKFAQIDTDADGRLVEAELVAWAKEHKGRHGKRHRRARRGPGPKEAPVAG